MKNETRFTANTLGIDVLRQKYLDMNALGTAIPLTDDEAEQDGVEETAMSWEDLEEEFAYLQAIADSI